MELITTGNRFDITATELIKIVCSKKQLPPRRPWTFSIYVVRIAQFDDKILKKNKISETATFCSLLLVNVVNMPDNRCSSIGGIKTQRDALLEAFGTDKEIIFSLSGFPSTTQSPLFSCLFSLLLKNWTLFFFLELL